MAEKGNLHIIFFKKKSAIMVALERSPELEALEALL